MDITKYIVILLQVDMPAECMEIALNQTSEAHSKGGHKCLLHLLPWLQNLSNICYTSCPNCLIMRFSPIQKGNSHRSWSPECRVSWLVSQLLPSLWLCCVRRDVHSFRRCHLAQLTVTIASMIHPSRMHLCNLAREDDGAQLILNFKSRREGAFKSYVTILVFCLLIPIILVYFWLPLSESLLRKSQDETCSLRVWQHLP